MEEFVWSMNLGGRVDEVSLPSLGWLMLVLSCCLAMADLSAISRSARAWSVDWSCGLVIEAVCLEPASRASPWDAAYLDAS